MSLTKLDKPTSNSINKKTAFRKNILTLAVVQALACSSTALYAATITVNSADDNVTIDGDGICTLREALSAANIDAGVDCTAGSGTDTITFDNSLSGSTITLAGTELPVQSNLIIDGDLDNNGTPDITIDAGGSSRVINAYTGFGNPITATFDGLTISGGDSGFSSGSGISARYYNNIIISNSTISGNTGGSGAGVSVDYGDLTITNSTISGNTSPSQGSGIFSYSSNITITDSTLSNNSSGNQGGAIFARYGSVNITNSTLSGNSASGNNGRGGAISTEYANITLTNSTLSGNTSDSQGGAIFTTYGNINLTNSTLSGNTATSYGGAIFFVSPYGGNSISLINSTISDNTSNAAGGGIYATNPSPYATSFSIINSILANNINGDCAGDLPVTTDTANLVKDGGAGCGMTPLLTVDPQLGALADNGGSTQTHLPQAGSPVLDAGDNTNCGTGLTVATDQRGAARDDGNCDIGAVEGSVSLLPLSSVQFDTSTATVSEDGTSITLNLTRSGDTTSAISVDYTTGDGTATAPADYTANMATLNFATGITSQSVTIDITDDTDVENDENFTVTLSNAQLVTGSAVAGMGTNTTATITITDNDASAGTAPGTDPATPASTSSSSNALSLNPWWMLLLGFTGWLRRKNQQ